MATRAGMAFRPGARLANSPDLLMRLARQGAGITALARHFAEPYLRNGELSRCSVNGRCPPHRHGPSFQGEA